MITHFYLLPRKTIRRKYKKVGKSKEVEKAKKDPTAPYCAGLMCTHLHIVLTAPGLWWIALSAAQPREAAICSFCLLSVAVRSDGPKQW